jgi:hypothetical protein
MANEFLMPAKLQSSIQWIDGSPEGRIHAPPGKLVIDGVTGNLYQKKTADLFDTGWVPIGVLGNGTGYRWKNVTTGLWHTVVLVGNPGEEILSITIPGDANP